MERGSGCRGARNERRIQEKLIEKWTRGDRTSPDQTDGGRSVMVTVKWWSLCVLTSMYGTVYCVACSWHRIRYPSLAG